MQSKRLKSTCKDIQQNDTEQCICHGGYTMTQLIEPCDVPCNPVMEKFIETMRYKDNE